MLLQKENIQLDLLIMESEYWVLLNMGEYCRWSVLGLEKN